MTIWVSYCTDNSLTTYSCIRDLNKNSYDSLVVRLKKNHIVDKDSLVIKMKDINIMLLTSSNI